MTNNDDILTEFITEAFEGLDLLDQDLLSLEKSPENLDIIKQVFRTVHTLKGTSGFFGFHTLESVSHCGEDLLDLLRNSKTSVTTDTVSVLLSLSDALREMLFQIQDTGQEGADDYASLKLLLNNLSTGRVDVPATREQSSYPVVSDSSSVESSTCIDIVELPTTPTELDDVDLAFRQAQQQYEEQQLSSMAQAVPESKQTNPAHSPGASATATPRTTKATHKLIDSSIRVDITVLDTLMNLVGELVLTRNQILQITKTQSEACLAGASQRLNLITSELQEGIMRTRMQPIATVWNKLPKIVREIAFSCGKQVRLEMHGEHTELDRTIIEAIKDPLTHIIRNSVDHGIEKPSLRETAGKPAEGLLRLSALHEGGQVIIEIIDDGGGLNAEKIVTKALERGLISPDRAARMTEAEVFRLIFIPGFSTADAVTNVSGRGVGMDVVRVNIEHIGGSVDVSSVRHRGTKFTIKIPLTLAIIPALIIASSGMKYAIPQVNLLELVRIKNEDIATKVEEIHGVKFYRLRGRLLPLISLKDTLEDNNATSSNFTATRGDLNIVVTQADNHLFGLVVDKIFDTEEIVVKPLGRLLKDLAVFAGATVMGDGVVALILDLVGFARRAGLSKEDAMEVQVNTDSTGNKEKLLLFQLNEQQRAAVALEEVYRLETFESKQIEVASDHLVVQYRGTILPLVDLREVLLGSELKYSDKIKTFVLQRGGIFIGFIVDRVIDVVHQEIQIVQSLKRPGLLGSAIIHGAVTDLIDVSSILDQAHISGERTCLS